MLIYKIKWQMQLKIGDNLNIYFTPLYSLGRNW